MIVLNQNTTLDIFIRGGWFTNTTTVDIPGITINSTTIVDDDTIRVNITTPTTDGLYDVEVTNEGGTTSFLESIEIKLSTWTDLRTGGDTFNIGTDLRVRPGITVNRDAQGMFFTGNNPWASWVKFESLKWNRGENKTLQWIFTSPLNFMMIGIGSENTDENSTSQFSQAEIQAYFNTSVNFWGLYGNNGNIGSAGNQNNNTPVTANSILKIKLEGDGGVGSTFTMYQLPSANPSDWDDETNILTTMTVGSTLNPDETVIMPFIIPRTDGQRFIALKLE